MSRSGETLLEREQESEPESTTEESPGRLTRVKRRVTPSMTGKSLLLAVVVTFAASALVGMVPLVPGSVATLIGLALGGFLLGVVRSAASYLEMAIAGGAAAALSLVSNLLLFSAAGNAGLAVAGGGILAGIFAGVIGHYFGRDLRDGLTRSL